jgi:hypothetical protein
MCYANLDYATHFKNVNKSAITIPHMNNRYFTLVTAIILTGLCSAAQADTLTGWVSHIADGDTITVLDYSNQQHKVRLMGSSPIFAVNFLWSLTFFSLPRQRYCCPV